MPTAELKLTKKQKKALAFRSRTRKLNQPHGATSEPQAETLQRSALEDEDHSSEERLPLEVGCVEEESTSVVGSDVKGKTRMDREVKSTQAQKRKRETSDDGGQSNKEKKKIKKEESSASATSQSKKGRFILFVGNYLLPISFLLRTDVYIYRQSQIYH